MTDADRHAASVVAAILARATGDQYVTAGEIVQALRGHGWRPPTAHQPQPWQPPPGARPLRGEQVHAKADAIRRAIERPLDVLDDEELAR